MKQVSSLVMGFSSTPSHCLLMCICGMRKKLGLPSVDCFPGQADRRIMYACEGVVLIMDHGAQAGEEGRTQKVKETMKKESDRVNAWSSL